MKKILGISLVAVLTAAPLMAGAAVDAADPGATVSNAPEAEASPKYGLVPANATNDVKFATAGYVKGAYNAAIKAVNKTAVDAKDGANLTNGTVTEAKLATDVQTKLNAGASALQVADITTGTEQMANGTISVDGTAVAVKGLGSAAFEDTTAFDAAGTAADLVAGLDGSVSQTAAATNGQLALSVTTEDGVVTAISGSIAENTYDAYGAASNAQTAAAADATTKATNAENNAKAYADGLVVGQAKEAGVLATVNAASATYTPAGTVSGTIPAMTDWENQTAQDLGSASFSFTGTQATINPQVASYQTGA